MVTATCSDIVPVEIVRHVNWWMRNEKVHTSMPKNNKKRKHEIYEKREKCIFCNRKLTLLVFAVKGAPLQKQKQEERSNSVLFFQRARKSCVCTIFMLGATLRHFVHIFRILRNAKQNTVTAPFYFLVILCLSCRNWCDRVLFHVPLVNDFEMQGDVGVDTSRCWCIR